MSFEVFFFLGKEGKETKGKMLLRDQTGPGSEAVLGEQEGGGIEFHP